MNSTNSVCGWKCALLQVNRINERKATIASKKVDSAKKRDLALRKLALKSKSDWLKECQTAFNAYIRARDKDNACISCGKFEAELNIKSPIAMVCGHYLSVGGHPEKRFNPKNGNLQCTRCNGGAGKYGKFNNKERTVTQNYRIRLIEKIGLDNVEQLEGDNTAKHYTIEQIKELKAEYAQKCRDMSK